MNRNRKQKTLAVLLILFLLLTPLSVIAPGAYKPPTAKPQTPAQQQQQQASNVQRQQQKVLHWYIPDSAGEYPAGTVLWGTMEEVKALVPEAKSYNEIPADLANFIIKNKLSYDTTTSTWTTTSSQTQEYTYFFRERKSTITTTITVTPDGKITEKRDTEVRRWDRDKGEWVVDQSFDESIERKTDGTVTQYTAPLWVGGVPTGTVTHNFETGAATYNIPAAAARPTFSVIYDKDGLKVNGKPANIHDLEAALGGISGVDAAMADEFGDSIKRNLWDQGKIYPWQFFESLTDIGDLFKMFGAFLGVYQEYKGLYLAYTTFQSKKERERLARRRQGLIEEFRILAGVVSYATAEMCDVHIDKAPGNAVVGMGIEGEPRIVMSVNAERSNPIIFKGIDRQTLIDIFGNYTYISGQLYNLSDPTIAVSKLPIIMRLYRIQYAVNNPLAGTLRYNLRFEGPDRSGTWFAQMQPVLEGERASGLKLKYSATEYSTVCITLDQEITKASGARIREMCVPIAEYGGEATTMEDNQQASQNQQLSPSQQEGAGI